MLCFDDPKWEEFEGGYRVAFDPRPALRQLELGSNDKRSWAALWENLHHQGDVGLASYASVPHLVRIDRGRQNTDWNIYGLVALIELMRTEPRNPDLPAWLQHDYFAAITELAKRALTKLEQLQDTETLQTILAVVALWKGMRVYARLLLNFSEEEISEIAKEVSG